MISNIKSIEKDRMLHLLLLLQNVFFYLNIMIFNVKN